MLKKLIRKIQSIQFFKEKVRFLLFSVGLFCCLFLASYLFKEAYASYYSKVRLFADIEKAVYLIDVGQMSFNIDSSKIIPSNTPHAYNFSVSNFTSEGVSEIDIEYDIRIVSTTNLPLSFELYKNEDYRDDKSTNLLKNVEIKRDSDGVWYRLYDINAKGQLLYTKKTTDIYTLVINFPEVYNDSLEYADCIENIEIYINSRQIID